MLRALVLGLLLTAAIARAADPAAIVFMSDFGTDDDSVAICKGVMVGISPQSRIVDLTHTVPPYSVADGARFLAGTAPAWPVGTVFVAVVDPGVGTSRRPVVARSKRGQWFVLPDNGLLTLVADRDGLAEVRQITNADWLRGGGISSTFHGRDIFAPVGAHIARGDDWTAVGPVITDPVRLPLPQARIDGDTLTGEVIAFDGPYGNLVTDVDAPLFLRLGWARGDQVVVRIGERELTLPFVQTFGSVPEGQPLLYIDSRERLAAAVNKGNFAERFGVTPGTRFTIRRKTP
ncbi:MAG TPA: SAM-dependent chlorinase/fluorinase [Candidatus Binatia bacterium]|jgi:S-adenosylmethionine hydrolase|nr:SAM-dependent chlorinase/fluorinase [Candidatus Binatia bacterium]